MNKGGPKRKADGSDRSVGSVRSTDRLSALRKTNGPTYGTHWSACGIAILGLHGVSGLQGNSPGEEA